MAGEGSNIRIAALGDIHYGRGQEALAPLLTAIGTGADVLLLLGDLTNTGLPDEARKLAKELTAGVKIPILAVLGNHDFESGKPDEIRQILLDAGVSVLDGEAVEVHNIGFAGVKGFAGGFDRASLQPWGEETIKLFVREAVNESIKLEGALAKLRTNHRIALLHYSPIRATVEGEPLEIFPYLGSSRLEDPINRHKVTAVFHGHAHNGTLEGKTTAGIPVYNVSFSILQRTITGRPPFYLLELPVDAKQPVPTKAVV